MSENSKPAVGTILWHDLTVPDAEKVRDFYTEVVGWKADPFPMGEYNDYNISSPGTGETIAGICHNRGSNEKLPPFWMIYISVENLDKSIESCLNLGGKVIDGPKSMGNNRYCIIMDPAGAYCALFE